MLEKDPVRDLWISTQLWAGLINSQTYKPARKSGQGKKMPGWLSREEGTGTTSLPTLSTDGLCLQMWRMPTIFHCRWLTFGTVGTRTHTATQRSQVASLTVWVGGLSRWSGLWQTGLRQGEIWLTGRATACSQGYGRHGHSRQAGPRQTGFSVSFCWLAGDRPKLSSQVVQEVKEKRGRGEARSVMKIHDQIKLSVLYQTFVMLKGYTHTRSCICQSTKRSVMITNVIAEYKIKKKYHKFFLMP